MKLSISTFPAALSVTGDRKPIHRRKGGFTVHKKSGGGSFVVRDSHGSFRDTTKAISKIKSGLPVKVFFALKDQINISTEELAHVVGIAPRTLLSQAGRQATKRGIGARRSIAAII